MTTEVVKLVEAVWRIEAAKVIAALTRVVRDVGTAEELAQDALVAALEQWPSSGVPQNPGAWLVAAAKHRAIDRFRRDRRVDEKHGALVHDEHASQLARSRETLDALETTLDDTLGDDVLRLMFIACHPVLSTEARTALTLRLVAGLTVEELGRAFLTTPTTMAQRLVRAKRALAEAKVPFEVPEGEALHARVSSVLEVLYFIFNEGYSATAGDDWLRPELCDDALRLGRMLADRVPHEPEVHGLVALMEIQASRAAARRGPSGEPVLLLDQDRSRWNEVLRRRGLAALDRADELLVAQAGRVRPGPYVLQAAIAAVHARAPTARQTDWPTMVTLYDLLAAVAPSPVVDLNCAVAVSMAVGPAAGLECVDALRDSPALERYHLLPSVRGDLLFKLGRLAEAAAEFERAASLTQNERERQLLRTRAEQCRAHA